MRSGIVAVLGKIAANEDINFLLTNRIPRQLLTRFVGWLSKIEQPLVRNLSIGIWKLFSDLDLGEAKKTRFRSMHDCFTRELKESARPIDFNESILVSPSDGIVGACGRIDGETLIQAKGLTYTLTELLGDASLVDRYREGCYVTLRLTASMYHRFHAPHDCTIEHVTYVSGDTWNVNPVALARIEKLFCKNERAILRTRLRGDHVVTLVPVAAVLVASIRLHCLDVLFHLRYQGPHRIACHAEYGKGQELGWFEHGSTIIVLAPKGFELCDGIEVGATMRMGRGLLKMPASLESPHPNPLPEPGEGALRSSPGTGRGST